MYTYIVSLFVWSTINLDYVPCSRPDNIALILTFVTNFIIGNINNLKLCCRAKHMLNSNLVISNTKSIKIVPLPFDSSYLTHWSLFSSSHAQCVPANHANKTQMRSFVTLTYCFEKKYSYYLQYRLIDSRNQELMSF